MKNSSFVFIFLAVLIVVALVIGYIYIPRLDQVNGTQSITNLVLDSPVRRMDLRYLEGGIVPFCKDKDTNGLSFELKPQAEIYASTGGTVTVIDGDMVEVQPRNGVALQYSELGSISVSVGDFVQQGDSLGSIKEKVFTLTLLNTSDDIYECPYSYFNGESQGIIDLNFENSIYSNFKVCNCSVLYK